MKPLRTLAALPICLLAATLVGCGGGGTGATTFGSGATPPTGGFSTPAPGSTAAPASGQTGGPLVLNPSSLNLTVGQVAYVTLTQTPFYGGNYTIARPNTCTNTGAGGANVANVISVSFQTTSPSPGVYQANATAGIQGVAAGSCTTTWAAPDGQTIVLPITVR